MKNKMPHLVEHYTEKEIIRYCKSEFRENPKECGLSSLSLILLIIPHIYVLSSVVVPIYYILAHSNFVPLIIYSIINASIVVINHIYYQ